MTDVRPEHVLAFPMINFASHNLLAGSEGMRFQPGGRGSVVEHLPRNPQWGLWLSARVLRYPRRRACGRS